ncbi:hypothetical protein Mal64_05800 [Pseudobythopirellula maris]|uniref:VWFA domain-containing protein n=2 Tax=Pseudobythopirellula maris TaxID=2527991 RepID=A0A5C5ZSI2_9BACT|nr:hypothetical protein Mal64_05800 [Pseudobythopirellula maris]
MLWSLLAIAPLVAVYLLRVRPRKRPTTAYFLWEKIFHEKQSTRLWRRLRGLLSLLLMALAFAAVAFALAEPRWSDAPRPDLLLLIDNSASMNAEEGGATRLEMAKERARDLVRALDGVQRAAVATAADRLRYCSHLSDNPRELLAAIDAIGPTNEAFRTAALPQPKQDDEAPSTEAPSPEVEQTEVDETTATQDAPPAEEADAATQRRVLLLSDGVLGGAETPAEVELVRVGSPRPNVGVVAADLAFTPGSVSQLSFYYQIASTHESMVSVDLLLYHEHPNDQSAGGRTLAKVIPLDVAPGLNAPRVMTVDGAEPGRWVAELDIDSLVRASTEKGAGATGLSDSLAADNTAWLVARRPDPITMSVATDERYFLEQGVLAFDRTEGGLRLVESGGEVVLAVGAADARDGEEDSAATIVFSPDGESRWWSSLGEEIEVAAPRVLIEGHPLLRGLDPLSIRYAGARQIEPPAGAQVLVASETGAPLIYTARDSGAAAVVVNLDPVAAEFYYSAWFPVLTHSAAHHLVGREEPLLAVYRPGDTPRLPVPDTTTGAELIDPLGDAHVVQGAVVPALASLGFYDARLDDEAWPLACGLLSAGETLLSPPQADPDTPAVDVASGSPPSTWLVALALLAVSAESLLYHRRKVG